MDVQYVIDVYSRVKVLSVMSCWAGCCCC